MNSSLQPVLPIAADADALRRALRRAGVAHDSRLLVTGPAGLTALIWLYRHDYPQAVYVPANRVADLRMPGDALLIPHACRTEELAEMLGDGHCVREGGALIVQAPVMRQAELVTVPTVLERVGFEVETQLAGRGHRIYLARRVGADGFRKAA